MTSQGCARSLKDHTPVQVLCCSYVCSAHMYALVHTLSHVCLFATPRTVAARLLCPWDFSGKNTGVGCCILLQGIFLTQGSNPHLLCLLHCRKILYHWDSGEAWGPNSMRTNTISHWTLKELSATWWQHMAAGSRLREPGVCAAVGAIMEDTALQRSWLGRIWSGREEEGSRCRGAKSRSVQVRRPTSWGDGRLLDSHYVPGTAYSTGLTVVNKA